MEELMPEKERVEGIREAYSDPAAPHCHVTTTQMLKDLLVPIIRI